MDTSIGIEQDHKPLLHKANESLSAPLNQKDRVEIFVAIYTRLMECFLPFALNDPPAILLSTSL